VLLADLAADVIKIEKPNGGDDARIWDLCSGRTVCGST
jgi:crotonobetainyl-CoA:carnitine CoA-transferase CaiB-like acyl-CoA transferase